LNKAAVDILMATYNGEAFVSQQIESILAQDYPHIRIVIRDDCSTDGTRAILEAYKQKHPSRIVLLTGEKRLGVRGNFSCLMGHAIANYVMFADQDDIWQREKVKKTLEKMEELESRFSSEKPLLVHTDLTVVNQDLKVIAPSFWRYTQINAPRIKSLNRLLVQPAVTGCTVMINRSLLKLAWPIPQNCVMHDSWLALVCAAFGQVEALPYASVLYRQHSKNSVGAAKFWSKKYLKQTFDKLSQTEGLKFEQGRELFSRYQHTLNKKNMRIIQAYLRLPHASFLQRCFLIVNYQLLRSGFVRNAVAMMNFRIYSHACTQITDDTNY
jgi:glycosyltransferase involved in cell wall biosynthesis